MSGIEERNKRLVAKALNEIQRRVAAGLEQAAATHAGLYWKAVTENRGVRPIPSELKYGSGPVGNPYRSQERQYPFEDPDTEPEEHGYEFISFAVDKKRLRARSGVKKEGMHLVVLSHHPSFVSEYGARRGMDWTFIKGMDAIAKAFAAGSKGGRR